MPPRRASRAPESKGKPSSSASATAAAAAASSAPASTSAPMSRKRSLSGGAPGKPESKRSRASLSEKPASKKGKAANGGVIAEAETQLASVAEDVEQQVEDVVKEAEEVTEKAVSKVVEKSKRAANSAVESLKGKASTRDHRNNSARARQKSFIPVPQPADHIRPPRTLLVFGTGDSGEFGLGDDERGEIARPRLHAWVEEAIEDGKFGAEPGAGLEAIAVGGMHSLAIDEKGRVWTWGVNDAGALGRRTDKVPNPNKPDEHLDRDVLESTPGIITALEKEAFRAVRVAGGDSVSIAISDDGRVRYWGSFRGNEGLLGFGGVKKAIQFDPVELPLHAYGSKSSTFVSVAAGSDHVLALASDGVVYAMGDCMKAQLGRRVGPRHVLKGLIPEQLALRKIEKIATGSWHSFAIDTEGRVYAWGFNGAGQCGVPSRTDDIVDRPTVIPSLLPSEHNGAKVVAIDAGSHHSLFLFSDGSLWGCGKIVEGEVGLSQDHPAMTAEAKEEQCITEPVQIFFPPTPTEDDKNPDMKPYEDSEAYRKASSKIVDIACGERFSLALTTDGHAYSWGLGVSMQLGLGNDTETAPTPTLIRGKVFNDYKPLQVAAGAGHCFIAAQKK